jgi:hypothetical protein
MLVVFDCVYMRLLNFTFVGMLRKHLEILGFTHLVAVQHLVVLNVVESCLLLTFIFQF